MLTGIDPNDPRPATRRELIFAAGPSSGGGKVRGVLLYGNKTGAGSEPANVIGLPINDDADAVARLGRRSELYGMLREYLAVDPMATVHVCAVPEAGGASAASAAFTFATTATAVSTVEVACLGQTTEAVVAVGDLPATIAAAVANAINTADNSGWPVIATANNAVVTVEYAQKGPRGDLCIGDGANRGMRMRFTRPCATTVTKGALTPGAGSDDFTAAYAEAANGEYYYQAIPCHAVTTVTAVDNQIGEGIEYIKTQALPANGKSQVLFIGQVGTQAEATAVNISAAANYERVFPIHAENCDWTPGMLAAHHMGIARSQQVTYPAVNLNGYTSTGTTIYRVPTAFLKGDRPSATEVKADLNNGSSPVNYTAAGKPYLERFITQRSLNAQGNNDYRAREGHIVSAIDFAWEVIKERWDSQKQPNISDDPIEGAKPIPLTSTPSQLKGIITSVIDDLSGPMPLGRYPGPILAPDRAAKMKASVIVTRAAATLSASAELEAVMHLLSTDVKISEVSPAY